MEIYLFVLMAKYWVSIIRQINGFPQQKSKPKPTDFQNNVEYFVKQYKKPT